jgi:hypothetical protein
MKNPVGRLKTAWYDKLNGSLTHSSVSVPVFREDANKLPSSHYVLIRAGGSRSERTDTSFMRRVSIFIQIVTKFSGAEGINDSIVEEIEEQITELINPTTSDDALVDGVYFQVNNVDNEDDTYETFIDTDQSIKYHIKTTRWTALVIQKNS